MLVYDKVCYSIDRHAPAKFRNVNLQYPPISDIFTNTQNKKANSTEVVSPPIYYRTNQFEILLIHLGNIGLLQILSERS